MSQCKWSDAPGGHQAQGVLQKVSGREQVVTGWWLLSLVTGTSSRQIQFIVLEGLK